MHKFMHIFETLHVSHFGYNVDTKKSVILVLNS